MTSKPIYNQFHAIIKGRVQGVGYRVFALEAARKFDVSGWVRNLPNGSVEVEAFGDEVILTDFLTELYKGPINGHVEDIDISWDHREYDSDSFEIRR